MPETFARARPRWPVSFLLAVVLVTAMARSPISARAQAGKPPAGELRWALHVTLAARWLDPAETEAFSTPFMVMYAIHDAMVKPMPAGLITPSLAESWTESKDHLTYTFVLRKGARFHNGEPVTAEDVKFSWDRYKGASAKLLNDKVKEVTVVDPGTVRFVLQGAVAGLHHLLRHHRLRRRLDRAEEVRREGRRGRLQDRADRRRALQGRLVQARRGAGAGGLRRLLAQGAVGQAPGDALDAGGEHAGRRAAGRRGRHRVSPHRARPRIRCARSRATGWPRRW